MSLPEAYRKTFSRTRFRFSLEKVPLGCSGKGTISPLVPFKRAFGTCPLTKQRSSGLPAMSDLELETEKGAEGDTRGRGIKSRAGLIATCALGGSLVALYAMAGPFIAPALRKICLPFVPATTTQVKNVLSALRSRSGTLVDIGSGDGRIVIAAARAGFRSVGFELNPWLVWYSRYKAWRQGVHGNTSFYISDLWKVSFSQYSNVVIFGVPQMMEQLETKLQVELQSSARVVACRFPFPTWTPDHVTGEGIDTVWVYDAKTFKSHPTTAKLLDNSEDMKVERLLK